MPTKTKTRKEADRSAPTCSPSYVPCGPEWEREVMKNPKAVIVAMLRNMILDQFIPTPFNVNHEIRVKLHKEGEMIYRKAFGVDAAEELAEKVTLQMWAFMSIFGPHLVPTMTPPFDPVIEILPENSSLISDASPSERSLHRWGRRI